MWQDIEPLEESSIIDEYNNHAIKSFYIFIISVVNQFERINNQEIVTAFISSLKRKKSSYNFLQDSKISTLLKKMKNMI